MCVCVCVYVLAITEGHELCAAVQVCETTYIFTECVGVYVIRSEREKDYVFVCVCVYVLAITEAHEHCAAVLVCMRQNILWDLFLQGVCVCMCLGARE